MIRERTDLIVYHCTATRADQDIGRDEIDGWHRDRGWGGIGYHYVVKRDGAVQIGRNLNEVGAHAFGYNRRSIGVVWAGGLDENDEPADNRTPQQKRSLKALSHMFGWMFPEAKQCGHRDLSPDVDGDGVIERWEWVKECPCFDVRTWIESDYQK